MRRGLGTGMAANGVPVDTVAQVLGHKETKATKQYISTDLQACAVVLLISTHWEVAYDQSP